MLQVTNLHLKKIYCGTPMVQWRTRCRLHIYCLTNIWVYSIKRYKSPFRRLLLASLWSYMCWSRPDDLVCLSLPWRFFQLYLPGQYYACKTSVLSTEHLNMYSYANKNTCFLTANLNFNLILVLNNTIISYFNKNAYLTYLNKAIGTVISN